MKRIGRVWNGLDFTAKLGIWVAVFYAMLYVVLDIMEALLGIAI